MPAAARRRTILARVMATAYLGLGSDLGDRVAWLRRGVDGLADAGLEIVAVSCLYLSEPVGDPQLPWFVNAALAVNEPPDPRRLLEICLAVERACGRRRDPGGRAPSHPGPRARSLDLDVLLYDRQRLEAPGLSVPHPRLHERRFVLRPLAEIAPAAVHPDSGRTVSDLLENLERGERVWLLAPFPGADGV